MGEAYGRVTIFKANVLQLLCDAIVLRRQELAPPLVVQAVHAAASLSYAHPGLIREAALCLEQYADDLVAEDAAKLTRALEILKADGDMAGLLERPQELQITDDNGKTMLPKPGDAREGMPAALGRP